MITSKAQQGSVTLLTLIMLLFLTTIAIGLARQIQTQVQTVALGQQETSARYAAEAGINLALAEIMNHPQTFCPQLQEILPGNLSCSAEIVLTQSDQIYQIYSDGNADGIHQKVTATVEHYPGKQPKVLIYSSFVNQ